MKDVRDLGKSVRRIALWVLVGILLVVLLYFSYVFSNTALSYGKVWYYAMFALAILLAGWIIVGMLKLYQVVRPYLK